MKRPAGNRVRYCAVIGIALLLLLFAAPAVSADSVTKGTPIVVTVIGKPYTPYYVWLTRTSSMTGLPGDQPPIVQGGQANIVQDDSGGPYTIGNYQYYGGGGYTILDDVAPSTASVPNTSYYAQVTTDENGYGTIAFQTSSNTAPQTFPVKVQNPASPSTSVNIMSGVPSAIRTTAPTTLIPTPIPTTAIQTTETTLPVTPEITLNATSASPTATKKSSFPGILAVAAIAVLIGIILRK
ncbi:MAG: hypothetical protein ABFC24_08445 [Methanoregulaceae archaeon]